MNGRKGICSVDLRYQHAILVELEMMTRNFDWEGVRSSIAVIWMKSENKINKDANYFLKP